MRIETLLEGISDVVYHYISLRNVVEVLKTDRFILTPAFTKGAEVDMNPREKLFFLSTARTRTASYHVGERYGAVLLVLDGRKLSHNHHGRAVDYWGENFRDANKGAYEEEDRIFSDKPFIENATQYIKSIDILETRWDDENYSDHLDIMQVYKLGISKGVDVRIYKNKQDWLRGSNRTVDMSSSSMDNDDVDVLLFLLTQEATEANMEHLKTYTRGLAKYVTGYHHNDLPGVISTLLHNLSSNMNIPLREKVGQIGMEMRKKGLKSPRELSDYIIDKWVP